MMRTRMCAAACLLIASAPLVGAATGLEYPGVHKPPRVLAMGGADVAGGGYPDALYTNPAGLTGLERGWHLEPLSISLASSTRTEGFVRRLVEALDIDEVDPQREALVEVLRDYRGRNLHGEGVILPAVAWRGRNVAVGVSWLGAAKFDGRSHQGFGQEGLLAADARSLTGAVAGLGWEHQRLRVGLAVKSLRRNRVNRTYSVRELVDLSQEGRSIADDRQSGRALGLDLGLQYQLAPNAPTRPQLGISIQNAPGLDFGAAGRIRETVTVGVSLRTLPGLRDANARLHVEYFDLLHRLPEDDSMLKRFRVGAEWYPWQRPRSAMALRAGIYQGALTAGFEYRWRVVRVGVTTYAEEQGAYAGQDRDRRYVLGIGLSL